MASIEGKWRRVDKAGDPANNLPEGVAISRRGDSDFELLMRYGDGQPDDRHMMFEAFGAGRATVGDYILVAESEGGEVVLTATGPVGVLTSRYAREVS
ncbi:MAG: hypothetical protein AAGI10_11230 [Pseudomonadota bacterium]